MKGEHPVEGLCELLQVSRSGYYRWRRAPEPAGDAGRGAERAHRAVLRGSPEIWAGCDVSLRL